MIFNEETRELTSETGYIKCIETNEIYDHSIYLGKNDNPNNYIEVEFENN